MFRYGIDAAAMDWIGNGDHDNGAGREYSWWLIQKFTDAYHVKDRFTPMFTYERSVAYPHGHRNCMFAKRGVRTLPRLAAPEGGKGRGRRPRRRHQDALPLPERAGRHLRRPHQRHQHGHRLARQRPRGRADRRDLPGRPHVLRDTGGAAGRLRPEVGQAAGQHRRLVPGRLHRQRSSRRATASASRPRATTGPRTSPTASSWPSGTTARRSWTRSRSGTATARPTTSSSTCAAARTSWATSSRPPRLADAADDRDRHEAAGPDRHPEGQRGGRTRSSRASRSTRARGPTRSRAAGVHYYYIRVLQADDEIAWASPMWIDYAK